jgi:hypothetical protein
MPVSDREIWTAANLIIKRLGAEARREAVERAGDMLVRGDAEAHVVWLRIYRAISSYSCRRPGQSIKRRSASLEADCLGGAGSYAGSFLSSFCQPVVLTGHLVEVLFERGRRRIGSQLPHAGRVFAVVIRRQRRGRWRKQVQVR